MAYEGTSKQMHTTSWEELRGLGLGALEFSGTETLPGNGQSTPVTRLSRRTLMLGTAVAALGVKLAFDPAVVYASAQEGFVSGKSELGIRNVKLPTPETPNSGEYSLTVDHQVSNLLSQSVMRPGSLRQFWDRIIDPTRDFRLEVAIMRGRTLNEPANPSNARGDMAKISEDLYGFKAGLGTLNKPLLLLASRGMPLEEMLQINLFGFIWAENKVKEEDVYAISANQQNINLNPIIQYFSGNPLT